MVNSRLGLFAAAYRQPSGAQHEAASVRGERRSFSRSYGARLPSSLARVLSRALAYSARLPVSVCGTGTVRLARGFSWALVTPVQSSRSLSSSRLWQVFRRIFLPDCLGPERADPIARWHTQRRSPIASLSSRSGAGMSTGCPSPTPFGLGLGPAKPRRTNLAWETLGFRRERFSLSFSLLMPGFALRPGPRLLTVPLHSWTERSPTMPTPPRRRDIRGFGIGLEPRYIFGAASLDQWAVKHSLKDGCF